MRMPEEMKRSRSKVTRDIPVPGKAEWEKLISLIQGDGEEIVESFKQEYVNTWTNNPVAAEMQNNIATFFDGIPYKPESVQVTEYSDYYAVGITVPVSKSLYENRIRPDQPPETISKEELLDILNKALSSCVLSAEIAYDDGDSLVIGVNLLSNILNDDLIYTALAELRSLKNGYVIEGYSSTEYSIRMRELAGDTDEF